MIGRLRGTVITKTSASMTLEVNGVGYIVLTPTRLTESALLDTELIVHTYLQVREDALTLYGFATTEEKGVFELFLGISGVGPKLALAVLSTYTPSQIQQAVATGSVSTFSAVSGIGKKNAERIILELKSKVWATELSLPSGGYSSMSDFEEALLQLGYSTTEISTARQNVTQHLALEDQIKQALAYLRSS